MPIHPREFSPAMKRNVPQLRIIRMHLTYLKENKDQGNRDSIVSFYLFKIWNKGKWIPGARVERNGYFGDQRVARQEHGDFKATWWWRDEASTISATVNPDFTFWGSKITVDCYWGPEMKRHSIFGRKAVTNVDSILKDRDITLPTNVHKVKAMVFPGVRYRWKSWTEGWMLKNWSVWTVVLENGEDSGKSLGLQGDPNSQS